MIPNVLNQMITDENFFLKVQIAAKFLNACAHDTRPTKSPMHDVMNGAKMISSSKLKVISGFCDETMLLLFDST